MLFRPKLDQHIPRPLFRRKTALILNGILITAYITIFVYAAGPWDKFIGFLMLASLNRSLVLYWVSRSLSTFLSSLTWQMFCAGVLTGLLWSVGKYWPSGVKIIVPLIASFIALMSLYPISKPIDSS